MKVQLAKVAGFCMGVRRAMEMALEASQEAASPVYTFGPLIHNPSALELLRVRGVEVLPEAPKAGQGTVLIRAHGIPPDQRESLERAGLRVIDATCPRVVKVQMLARHYARKGYHVVLIGDLGHPEVVGIMGHAGDRGLLVSSQEDIERLHGLDRYIILAQTTQDQERFAAWSQAILARHPGGRVFNTICNSTHKRQAEVRRLATEVDAVVVVGGKKSANTRRLAEIVEEAGKVAIAIETEADLDPERLAGFRNVGVTAGASTPNWIINRVVREIEAVPGRFESPWRRAGHGLLRFLHESNLWTALAGGALAAATELITAGRLTRPAVIPMACAFIFAMHTLNRLMDRESTEYNDHLKARLLRRYRHSFFISSLAALALSLGIAWGFGRTSFGLLLLLSVFGILYTIPVVPGGKERRPLKDVPGSKPLFVGFAWASVASLVPYGAMLFHQAEDWVLFVFAWLIVVMRSALLEVLDLQGDRIVGRETLAILVGEEQVAKLVRILALILAAGALSAMVLGLLPGAALAFFPVALWLYWLSKLFSRRRLGQDLRLELMVESVFFLLLAGVVLIHLGRRWL